MQDISWFRQGLVKHPRQPLVKHGGRSAATGKRLTSLVKRIRTALWQSPAIDREHNSGVGE
jgi:hypothetical protein